MAARQDFDIDQGADWAVTIAWTDSEGEPVDLDGYTARLHMRPGKRGEAVAELDNGEGQGITLGPEPGSITLALSAAETAELPPALLDYDLVMTSPEGAVKRLIQGVVNVSEGVTV